MSSWPSVTSIAVPLTGAAAILVWRLRETRRPVTPQSILLPPLAMSTGFSMFLMPEFRIPTTWALAAFLIGAFVLAIPLIRSTELTRRGDVIMVKRSRAFLAILIALVAIRLALRNYVEHILPVRQTAGLFFILAFGMIVRWRLWMWRQYWRTQASSSNRETTS
jgi:membrane protein CcdC involved in cytochrome C biogenesis